MAKPMSYILSDKSLFADTIESDEATPFYFATPNI
jgi:hypothetical protein